jgi:hypothetical protein
LIANSPGPCHACCVLLRGKTNIKVRGRLHQRLARLLHLAQQTVYLSKDTHRSCKATSTKVSITRGKQQAKSRWRAQKAEHTCASSSCLLSRGRRKAAFDKKSVRGASSWFRLRGCC